MSFGRAFATRKEASAHVKKLKAKGTFDVPGDLAVRKMSKKLHPRRKNLFHVGGEIDFLNFA